MTQDQHNLRLVTALWLGMLSFLYISMVLYTPFYRFSLSNIIMTVVIAILFSSYGYMKHYKIMLQPAAKINLFPTHCVAGTWLGLVGIVAASYINSKLYNEIQIASKPTTYQFILSIALSLLTFSLGWKYLAKLLLKPQINTNEILPSIKSRVMASIWYAITASLFTLPMQGQGAIFLKAFIIMLPAYLGFSYGWQILSLPSTVRGFIKALLVGVIGTTYATLIYFSYFAIPSLYSGIVDPNISMLEGINMALLSIFMLAAMASIFFAWYGMLSTLLLFIVSRFIR